MGQQSKKGLPSGRCTVCVHPDRARIDYLLIATAGEIGGGRKSLAGKFGLSEGALYRHRNVHIPASYIEAVKVGPIESEARLRRLAAEAGGSVLERLNGIYGGHLARWLRAFESENDPAMVKHGRLLADILTKTAHLTRELMPPGSTFVQNNFVMADAAELLRVLQPFPAARQAIIDHYTHRAPVIEHAAA